MKRPVYVLFMFALFAIVATSFDFDLTYHDIKVVALESQLKAFLESLKNVMKSGNDTLGIPVLDPFETDFQNVAFHNDFVSINGNVSDVKTRGLSNYRINEAGFKFAGKQLTLNLTWSSIQIKTSYGLTAFQKESPDFPIYGNGDVELDARDFTFAISIKFNIAKKTNKLSVNTLSSKISLRSIDFRATGIYNNEDASDSVSKIISSSLPHVMDCYQSLFIGTIDTELAKLVNSYICDKTLDDIIGMIG